MKTFEDLVFKNHLLMHRASAKMHFQNGYSVFVLKDLLAKSSTYGTYSVGILKNGVQGCSTPEIENIENNFETGAISKERVTEIMKKVQELGDSDKWVKVTEFLPQNTKPVLVKGKTPSGEKTIQVGRLYKSGWVTDTYFKVDVKEWKPIY